VNIHNYFFGLRPQLPKMPDWTRKTSTRYTESGSRTGPTRNSSTEMFYAGAADDYRSGWRVKMSGAWRAGEGDGGFRGDVEEGKRFLQIHHGGALGAAYGLR
jgi:hypothetical protein